MCRCPAHPPSCNCAWFPGCKPYDRKFVPTVDTQAEFERIFKMIRSRDYEDIKPFITPNATCPVCRQTGIYFWQGEKGQRVFFDDIPWPWPLHPCTSGIFYDCDNRPIRSLDPKSMMKKYNLAMDLRAAGKCKI